MGSEYTGAIFQQWITDPEFVDIYLKGTTELEALNKNEKFRFINFVNHVMRYFEHQFVLYESDALPADFWIGQETSLHMIVSAPGVRESWSRQEVVFLPSFRNYVSSQLAKPPLPIDDLLS